MNAICFVVDRLHAGHLGSYGNAWIETPCLDRLAAQSLVFDRVRIDSPQLDRLYRSYWHGLHAMCPVAPDDRPSLAELLRSTGVNTTLLTDDPDVARHPLAADFDELVEIDPPWQPETADQLDHTQLARCCVEIIRWLESAREPFMLWCHLGSLGTTWDAPLTYRRAYVEPGDPAPPNDADVPDRMLPANHDPDERLGVAQAYAGQVTLLDTCLGAMLECIDGLPSAQQTLLSLTSARGFPLGEHLRVGPCDHALYGELVQVPWLLRLPDQRGRSMRSQSLVEPADLWATLLDYWGVEPPTSPTAASVLPIADGRRDATRDRLCMVNDAGQRAICTPAWHLRLANPPELFVKPDDRWEVNDVASRCREVVECLEDALVQFEQTVPAGKIADLPPLGDVLRNGLG
ncbi:MAG: sulfatase-like hydrolase/transferase [Thermoguttaceae bacterium]